MNAKSSLPTALTEPVVMAGSHEPLIFRRRAGYASVNEAERFAYEHSEELVERLAKRGISWVRTHFFKGFGLKAEQEEIEMTRRFVQLCHRYGIKVELYTQFGTLQYETFLDEEPGMLNWCAVNEQGRPVTIRYGHHDFRLKPCTVRDGYWRYLKKVLKIGIEHVKGDGFGFDNVESPQEPDSCHCPQCRQAFVRFLKRKYRPHTRAGRKLATERFGFAVLDHIRPPTFNRWNPAETYRIMKNPVFQEWAEFRAEKLTQRFQEIWEYVKPLKQDMLIEYNVYPPFGKNSAWWQGIDMHRLGPWMDAFWNERPPSPPEFRIDEGHLWHRVHAYKLAQALKAVVFTGHGGRNPEQQRLALGECLAFNQGHVGGLGRTTTVAAGANSEADAFINFRKRRAELFNDTKGAAEVGLVESSTSLANNSVEPYLAEILAMCSLLAGHVPFNLVTDIAPETLARYRVVVLPDVECVTDEQARSLHNYVAHGGGLVLTERTSLYDGWRRRRRQPALTSLLEKARGFRKISFGPEVGENTNVPQAEKPGNLLTGRFGKGRFTYLSRLEPASQFTYRREEPHVGVSYWSLPGNWKLFVQAVTKVAQGRLMLEVTAPPGLAAEARQAGDGRLLLHLVNYRLDKPALRISVKLTGLKVERAQLWSPWQPKPGKLRLVRNRSSVRIAVGSVGRYAIVEIVASGAQKR